MMQQQIGFFFVVVFYIHSFSILVPSVKPYWVPSWNILCHFEMRTTFNNWQERTFVHRARTQTSGLGFQGISVSLTRAHL